MAPGIYPIQYDAPDLSNIYGLARRTGRNAGYNEFMSGLIDHQRDMDMERLKSRLKAQQEAASEKAKKNAEDAKENDSDGEGFFGTLDKFYEDHIAPWSEKADIGGRAMDILSRGNYAVANAFQTAGNQAYDKDKGIFDMSGVDNTVKAFWKGLTGEKKTTFSKVIAKEAKENPNKNLWDNKWVQAGVGLTMDIALDPTTYVGAGIITRPLKAITAAEKESSSVGKLAGEIEKLGVRPEKGFRKNPVITEDGHEVPLTFDEIYHMLGGKQGRTTLSVKSQRVQNARNLTESLPRLKKWIRETPEIDTAEGIKHLEDSIKNLRAQRKAAVGQAARQAYEAKAAEFDANPKLWAHIERPTRRSLLDEASRATQLGKTSKAFKNQFFRTRAEKAGAKITNPSFDDTLGEGWKRDARISDEFRATAQDRVQELASKDKVHQTFVRRSIQAGKYKTKQEELLARAIKEGAPEKEIKAIRSNIERTKKKIAYYGDRQNYVKARIFHTLLRHHVGGLEGASKKLMDELSELTAKRHALEQEAKQYDNLAEGNSVRTSGEVTEDQSMVFDRGREIENELKQIDQRISQIENDSEFLPVKEITDIPEGAPKTVSKEFLQNETKYPEVNAWRESIVQEMETRADDIYQTKSESFLRKAKDDALKAQIPEYGKLRGMFGNPAKKESSVFGETIGDDLKTPMIKVNGRPVYQTDKDALSKLVTDEDRAVAASKSQSKPNSAVLQEAEALRQSIKDNKRLLNDGIDKDGNVSSLDAIQGRNLENTIAKDEDRLAQLTNSGKTTVAAEHVAFERLFLEQHGKKLSTAIRWKNTKIKDIRKEAKALKTVKPQIPEGKLRREAEDEALQGINKELKSGTLKVHQSKNFEFELWDDADSSLEDMYRAAVDDARDEYAGKVFEAKHSNEAVEEVNAKLAEARKLLETKKALHKEAFEEARKAREAMADRLDEQLLLNMLDENIRSGKNYLHLTFAGAKVADIPTFEVMAKAAEKLSGVPLLNKSADIWAKSFKPASKMEPELNLARLRAQARTPDIIKHHVVEIRQRFSKYTPDERKAALKALSTKAPVGNREAYDEMNKYFEEMVPYLTGKVDVGGDPLTIREINRYLREDYQFVGKSSKYIDNLDLSTPKNIVDNLRRLPENADPMKVMWNLRIASEQALADKAMRNTIINLHGVRRIKPPKDAPEHVLEQSKMIEALRDNHNWTTVRDLGEDVFFPADVATDVKKLLDMMKPEKVKDLVQVYDKALRGWKSLVTVYNPGYYTRNAIGESIMSAFDGLTNPTWYRKASQVLKYSMPDEMDEVLKSLDPYEKFKKSPTLAQRGSQTVMEHYGKKLTAEDIWVLYHDVGLKSGFISSEFEHFFPSAGSFKASRVGQRASKINDGVREHGEKFEDYFRLSHFMYALNRSGERDIMAAAQEAATAVRKYHFDYTDFTPTEKAVMMRIFPFYKWTRKALPLMVGMAFTQPGKAMIYPKMMSALSVATGGTDPLKDDNGFSPNFEEDTPEWMKHLMSYPIGRDQEDNMTSMHVATPQFDTYNMIANPISSAIGMLTPGFKYPLEQIQGHPIDPEFAGMEIEGAQARTEHTMRQIPFGSFMAKIMRGQQEGKDSALTEPSGLPDEALVSFLTGLGFYENNDARKQGARMSKNLGG